MTPAQIKALEDSHRELMEALEPFANFIDSRRQMTGDLVITQGSMIAKRQLKMADCYQAELALANARNLTGDGK